MFGKKKVISTEFDPQTYHAVLKCSICTGEKVAGFKHLKTGEFREIMMVRTDKDLAYFKEMYCVDEITKEY